jgi:peptidoglycan/LPS O-acetylase OafA/YrhL
MQNPADPGAGMAQTYRADIDGLRALAVVPVVLFHAGVPGFPGGFVGVDVFFVISGYLIATILAADLEAGRFSILRFYQRRARRILPALLAVSAVTALAATVLLMPPDLVEFGLSLAGTVAFFSNFVFAAGAGYFDAPALTKPLLHTWSLAIEEQFYILFPWLLALLWRIGRGTWRRARAAILVLAALSLAGGAWGVATAPENAFFMPHWRFWELMGGALLALGLLPPWRHAGLRELAAALGLAGILVPVALWSEATPFPGPAALPPVIGTMLVIHAGFGAGFGEGRTRVAALLSLPPVRGLGLVSYSLYLVHWPLIVFATYVLMRPLAGAEIAALLAVALLLAILSWRYVELPFRRPGGVALRPFAWGAAGVAAALLLAAGAMDLFRGFPTRFAPEVAEIVAAKERFRAANDACHRKGRQAMQEEGGPETLACPIGTEGVAPSFVLWGDSHAMALRHGIDLAAKRAGRGGMMVVHGGCPPLLGVVLVGRQSSHRCDLFNARVIAWLAELRVPLVIVAARWALPATGERYTGEDGEPMRLALGALTDNGAIFAAALPASVAAARATGAEVVLVGPVPELGFNAAVVYARALAYGRTLPEGPARTDFLARQALPLATLARLAGGAGVRLLRLDGALCPGERCRIAEGGRILYFDDDHLSLDGAEFLSPLFDPVLAAPGG